MKLSNLNVESENKQSTLLSTAHSEFQFVPIWNIGRQEVIGSFVYLSSPKETREAGLWPTFTIDEILGCRLAQLINTIRTKAMKNFFVVPLDYEVVRSTSRFYNFLSTMRKLPSDLLAHVTFELINFPSGHPINLLIEKVRQLRSISRAVLVRMNVGEIDLHRWKVAGALGATYQLPDRLLSGDDFTAIKKALNSCSANELPLFFSNANFLSHVPSLLWIGADCISGTAIGAPDVAPHARSPYCYENLYNACGH